MDISSILTPVTKDGSSCEYHRVELPFQGLGIQINKKPNKDSVLFFNRLTRFTEHKKFILDLDDYWHLPYGNIFKEGWDRAENPFRIMQNIKNALAVLVTNEQLADKVKEFNKNVHIVPNALPFDSGQFTKTVPDFKRMVFAGGLSHSEDIKMLHGLNVEYYGGLQGSKSFPLGRYMDAYNEKGISLVPLIGNDFNACKSNLKVLEAGAKGIAVMCSDVLPYANAKDRPYIFLTSDFRRGVGRLSPELMADKAKALSEHVRKEYHLDKVNKERKQILEHYCKKA